MSFILAGQISGIAFACGLNLYATVAVLGVLSRLGLVHGLPPGLQGLGGGIVIASALVLYVVEAVVDKIHHADSLWDAVHTFIRPPAAALLAVGALWGQSTPTVLAGAVVALLIALVAHATKAGSRMALNATLRTGTQTWVSISEDVLAVALAITAFQFPVPILILVAAAVVASAFLARGLWRALCLGLRSIAAWLRSIFRPAGWTEGNDLPAYVRRQLGETPLGAAPPRGSRAAIYGLPGTGPFRNGWFLVTAYGPLFAYRVLAGPRTVSLPEPRDVRAEPGIWADIAHVTTSEPDSDYTLLLLKDGPELEAATETLHFSAS